jgi:hypothetical protein
LRRRDTLSAARQKCDAERLLHVADAGRGGGEREVRAFGTVGNAASLDHVTKQAEIREIEPHGGIPSFVFCEAKLSIMPIATRRFNVILSHYAKRPTQHFVDCNDRSVAARARIG